MTSTMWRMVLPLVAVLSMAACARGDGTASATDANGAGVAGATEATTIPLTITSANGKHVFNVETAKTAAEQERGLMYRTDLKPDGGMIFWPYPPEGGPPREASFWMKNTPAALDIVFIRSDGTIARIAENTVPLSEAQISSGEPIGAVLELIGGRTSALGIAEGDRVMWRGHLAR